MPPFKGWEVFLEGEMQALVVNAGQGDVKFQGGWLVVTVDDVITSYPARRVVKVEQHT